MNTRNIFLGLLTLVIALFACDDKTYDYVMPEGKLEPVILSPDGSMSYTLIEGNDKGAFETFHWKAANLGKEVTYELQFDDSEGDFSSPQVLPSTKELYLITTVEQMNQIFRDMNIESGVPSAVQVRVKAVGSAEPVYSNPLTIVVTRYIYDDEKPVWKVKGSALTAAVALKYDEADKLWKSDGAVTMTEGTFNFLNDNVYKKELGSVTDLVYAPTMEGDLTYEEGKSIPVKTYDYFITLDAENLTFKVEEDNYYTLTGSAVLDETARFKEDGSSFKLSTHLAIGSYNVKFNGTQPIIYGATGAADYTLIEGGIAIEVTKEADYVITIDENMLLTMEESTYPAELYINGSFVPGWNWDDPAVLTMIPVHSNPHLFWKIAWFDANSGLKINSAKAWNGGDFGRTGDADGNGVFAIGGENVPTGAEGYKMIVVNLLTNTIQITDPVIYAQGSAFGNWNGGEFLFTPDPVDAKILVSPAAVADDNARMYVTASTLTNSTGNVVDWWQAEFNVLSGNIEYRGAGNDQAPSPILTGQKVKLNFSTETGVFE